MDQSLPTGFRLDSSAGFFAFLPSRLGLVAALDDATDCMLAVHSTYLSMTGLERRDSRAKYVRAIRSLRNCLSDATTRTSSEVICAILLLGYNEYFLGFSASGFSSHVQGAYQLIQLRGQATFKDEFEKSILHSNASDMLYESIWGNTHSTPATLLLSTSAPGSDGIAADTARYSHQISRREHLRHDPAAQRWQLFSRHVTTINGVIAEFKALGDHTNQSGVRQAHFIADVHDRRHALIIWYKQWSSSSEAPITWLESLPADYSNEIATVRCYSCNTVAISITMYWWLLIFLNRMILALRPDVELSEENARIAEDLCSSHWYAMQQKPFGSYFNMAPVSLRIALPEIKDDRQKIWLREKLREIHSELRIAEPDRDRITLASTVDPGIYYPLQQMARLSHVSDLETDITESGAQNREEVALRE